MNGFSEKKLNRTVPANHTAPNIGEGTMGTENPDESLCSKRLHQVERHTPCF